ncbi:MAG: formimidoylglutamate deiminase [Candidatus Dormibacteraceae bacterium]
MTRYLAELAWTGSGPVREAVLLEVEGDRFTGVEPGAARPADAIWLPGLTIPGLANAHSHAFHRALRGRTQSGTGDFWAWRNRMYEVAASLDPDTYLELATATYAEMALAGITAVGEFHYLHHAPGGRPYGDRNEMGRTLVEAARRAGIRITLLDTCYLRGGIDGRPSEGAQLRFSDGSVEAWAARVSDLAGDARVRLGAAIHSVRALDERSMGAVAAWARAHEAPLHFHLSEQPAENAACLAATGLTPAGLLARARALGPRSAAVHAIHLTPEDVGLLGLAGVGACLCPTTERDLADGVGPARPLADAGCRLCLGSDSHAVIDLFEEARALELDQRLVTNHRGLHTPEELLGAATAGGMTALGWPASGLAPGQLADFVTVDLDSPRLAGAERDSLLAQAVYAAAPADVSEVFIGGRRVVTGKRHLELDDVPRRLAAAIRRALGG